MDYKVLGSVVSWSAAGKVAARLEITSLKTGDLGILMSGESNMQGGLWTRS